MAEKTDKPSPYGIPLPMVLLRHDTPGGHHYDWLMVNPHTAANPAAKVWTARVNHPSSEWTKLKRWQVEPIGDHRREYLTYEGPLSDNRGSVRRVDEGTFVATEWTEDRMKLNVAMRDFTGIVELRRDTNNLWNARALPSSRSG